MTNPRLGYDRGEKEAPTVPTWRVFFYIQPKGTSRRFYTDMTLTSSNINELIDKSFQYLDRLRAEGNWERFSITGVKLEAR